MRGPVAVGGALGSLGRVGAGLVVPPLGTWPVATTLVNVSGALLLGALLALTDDPRWRAALGTGALGAWTTFSTFAVELDQLLRVAPVVAFLHAGVTVGAGLAAARLGARVGHRRRRAVQR